jgi:hypothetical protein
VILGVLVAAGVAVLGLLLWALASNAVVKEAGKILFFCGVLVTLLIVGGKHVRI